MGSRTGNEELTMEKPANRERARRWGVGALILLVGLLGWTIYRDTNESGRDGSSLERGIRQLAFGIERRERSHFIASRKHLADATSGVYVERYPAFVLQTIERVQPRVLEGEQPARSDAPTEAYYHAIAEGNYAGARRWVKERENEPAVEAQSKYMLRLVEALERLRNEDVVE